jgi:hypothetical protein
VADDTSPTCTFPDVATKLADTFCDPNGGSENGSGRQAAVLDGICCHLHAGCYPTTVTAPLMCTVRRDPDGVRMLDALVFTQLAVRPVGNPITDE